MTMHRWVALGYFVVLLVVAGLNQVPGITDAEGRVFGIFALDVYDDALHLASALWALASAAISTRASRRFLLLFGAAYLADGLLGLATGVGYLDLAILTIGPVALPLGFRVMANLPHVGLGGIALLAGLRR